MVTKGVMVEQSVIPTSIELSHEKPEHEEPNAYPVKVCSAITCILCKMQSLDRSQVTLKHLDSPEREEIVYAKFVLGSDGEPGNDPQCFSSSTLMTLSAVLFRSALVGA